VEEGFELGKDCFGLDQSQVRLYTAIARHTVLVMAALAICAVTAALLRDRTGTQAPDPVHPGQLPPPDPGMIPLTVPEIKRLLAALLTRTWPPGHAARWLSWRRRHQARSRWYHKRSRLARDAEITLVSQRMAAAVVGSTQHLYLDGKLPHKEGKGYLSQRDTGVQRLGDRDDLLDITRRIHGTGPSDAFFMLNIAIGKQWPPSLKLPCADLHPLGPACFDHLTVSVVHPSRPHIPTLDHLPVIGGQADGSYLPSLIIRPSADGGLGWQEGGDTCGLSLRQLHQVDRGNRGSDNFRGQRREVCPPSRPNLSGYQRGAAGRLLAAPSMPTAIQCLPST
jgi:hypothetical protein